MKPWYELGLEKLKRPLVRRALICIIVAATGIPIAPDIADAVLVVVSEMSDPSVLK